MSLLCSAVLCALSAVICLWTGGKLLRQVALPLPCTSFVTDEWSSENTMLWGSPCCHRPPYTCRAEGKGGDAQRRAHGVHEGVLEAACECTHAEPRG